MGYPRYVHLITNYTSLSNCNSTTNRIVKLYNVMIEYSYLFQWKKDYPLPHKMKSFLLVESIFWEREVFGSVLKTKTTKCFNKSAVFDIFIRTEIWICFSLTPPYPPGGGAPYPEYAIPEEICLWNLTLGKKNHGKWKLKRTLCIAT